MKTMTENEYLQAIKRQTTIVRDAKLELEDVTIILEKLKKKYQEAIKESKKFRKGDTLFLESVYTTTTLKVMVVALQDDTMALIDFNGSMILQPFDKTVQDEDSKGFYITTSTIHGDDLTPHYITKTTTLKELEPRDKKPVF